MPKAKTLTIETANAFVKDWEKKQSSECQKELETLLKKYNRKLEVVLTMDENETIRKQIILIKAI